MLEISKMVKSLTDTETELKRIIQAIQVHERGIYVDYKVKIIDNTVLEFYIIFNNIYENDKFITGLISIITETLNLCDSYDDNGKITMVFYKYIF